MKDIKQIVKEKFKAFAVHFALSFLVLSLIISFIYFVWYPGPILQAVQASKILLLIILIDVVLGPLLTFIVYKKNKKTLKMDLAVIGFVQVIALAFGISSLALAKPVWIVFNGNKFELIQKNEIIYTSENTPHKFLSSHYWSKPKFVAATLSNDSNVKEAQIMDEVFSGTSLAQKPENYVEIQQVFPEIVKSSYPLQDLYKYNDQARVDAIIERYSTRQHWLPLKAKEVDMVVLVGNTENDFEIVDLRPWH